MLKGQAKTDYMREYMRRKRSNKMRLVHNTGLTEYSENDAIGLTSGSNKGLTNVEFDADGNEIFEE